MYTPALPVLYPLRSVDTATVQFTEYPHGRLPDHHRPPAPRGRDACDAARLVHPPRRHDEPTAARPSTATAPGIRSTTSDGSCGRPAPNGGAAEGRAVSHGRGLRRPARIHRRRGRQGREARPDRHPARPQRVAGIPVFQLEHTWSAGADGAHYVTVMDLGSPHRRCWRPVNRVIRQRFPDDKARAWVKHNIEEVGQLEYLLPQLAASGESDETEPAQRAQCGDGTPGREHGQAEPVH